MRLTLASLLLLLNFSAAASPTTLQCMDHRNNTRIVTFDEAAKRVTVDGSDIKVWPKVIDGQVILFTHTTKSGDEWEIRIVRSNGVMTTFNKTNQRPGAQFICSATVPRAAF